MSPWVSKVTFAGIFLGIASLYHASSMTLGWNFCGAVAVTCLFGLLIVKIVQLSLRLWSAVNTLNAFISTVVGFGAAAFISMCSHEIFAQSTLPPAVSSAILFLLPFSLAVICFGSLKAFAFFRSETALHPSESLSDEALGQTPRKFIPDQTVLEDGRVVDLARTGLFDGQIIVPSFLPRDLKSQSEIGDDTSRMKARKALEALRRLESLPRIGIQFRDVAVPETVELNDKILHSAKVLNAFLFTNEITPFRSETEQGMYLAIDTIANSLRPPIPKGEMLSIKIQRLGKEPKQGIGYLDDGTMVVVNGGGDFLGKSVRTQVLSQKFSSSGKIVFCNVREDGDDDRSIVMQYGQPETNYCGP
jgi:uncharacterized protein YacL